MCNITLRGKGSVCVVTARDFSVDMCNITLRGKGSVSVLSEVTDLVIGIRTEWNFDENPRYWSRNKPAAPNE
jgi:hypothetical protein